MTWTYDPSTTRGMVRLTISDTDNTRQILSDAEIDAFLAMAGNSVPLAAAKALETIATNEVLCLKVVQLMGAINTDAASMAKQLLAHAKTLREEADQGAADESGFVTIEVVDGTEARREKFAKVAESESY